MVFPRRLAQLARHVCPRAPPPPGAPPPPWHRLQTGLNISGVRLMFPRPGPAGGLPEAGRRPAQRPARRPPEARILKVQGFGQRPLFRTGPFPDQFEKGFHVPNAEQAPARNDLQRRLDIVARACTRLTVWSTQ